MRCFASGNRKGKHLYITIKPEFAYFPKKVKTGKYVWLRTVWKETVGIFNSLSCLGTVSNYHETDPGITVDTFYYLKENDYVVYASSTHYKRTSDLHEIPVFIDGPST